MEKNISSGKVIAVSVSQGKGTPKKNVPCVELKEGWGILHDAHAGPGNRQVSLLAMEAIALIQDKGVAVKPGDFGENITTSGIALEKLQPGDRVKIGREAILEISQQGKKCHQPCRIFYQIGDCIMPRQGLFGRVIRGGMISPGDLIERFME